MSNLLELVVLGFLVMALVGCSGSSVDIQQGGELQASLRKLSEREDRSVPLSALTDFSWETVHVFHGYAPETEINRTVGQPVVGEGLWDWTYRVDETSNLVVFTSGGRVVKMVSVRPDLLLTDGRQTWGSGVRVEPTTGPSPLEGYLRLVAPARASRLEVGQKSVPSGRTWTHPRRVVTEGERWWT